MCPGLDERITEMLNAIPGRPLPTYDHLSYHDFLHNHVIPNKPFLLSSKATSTWRSRRDWALPASPSTPNTYNNDTSDHRNQLHVHANVSRPNLSALRKYSHHIVPVANTLKPEFSEFERTERPLSSVLDLWEQGDDRGVGLYVKDWHLLGELDRAEKGVKEVYEVPECFRDDWLNPPYSPGPRATPIQDKASSPEPVSVLPGPPETADQQVTTARTVANAEPRLEQSTETETETKTTTIHDEPVRDFRFTYLGPSGTFTPLHRDVYASYSWSANIVGRKIWWLFPPDRLSGVMRNGKPVFDVRELEEEGGGIKVLQQEGEIIFVPSGWYHQVLNVDFCISINHNFFASPTLPSIFTTLEQSQDQVEDALSDVKLMIQQRLGTGDGSLWEEEWVEEVQKILEMDAGWGWRGFWENVRDNLNDPPADINLRPTHEAITSSVRDIIKRYQARREWTTLRDVRAIVLQIEEFLAKP